MSSKSGNCVESNEQHINIKCLQSIPRDKRIGLKKKVDLIKLAAGKEQFEASLDRARVRISNELVCKIKGSENWFYASLIQWKAIWDVVSSNTVKTDLTRCAETAHFAVDQLWKQHVECTSLTIQDAPTNFFDHTFVVIPIACVSGAVGYMIMCSYMGLYTFQITGIIWKRIDKDIYTVIANSKKHIKYSDIESYFVRLFLSVPQLSETLKSPIIQRLLNTDIDWRDVDFEERRQYLVNITEHDILHELVEILPLNVLYMVLLSIDRHTDFLSKGVTYLHMLRDEANSSKSHELYIEKAMKKYKHETEVISRLERKFRIPFARTHLLKLIVFVAEQYDIANKMIRKVVHKDRGRHGQYTTCNSFIKALTHARRQKKQYLIYKNKYYIRRQEGNLIYYVRATDGQ